MPEHQFWDMTINEIVNFLKAKRKEDEARLQERALMDYKLANLIMLAFHDHKSFPEFREFYSFLNFEDDAEEKERKEQERRDELTAIRFRQFADSFNARFKAKEV